jgi:glycosyltransferase involved in cell wall biosynthesis
MTTLTALASQTDLNGQPLNLLTYEIIVLANNCSDESAAIARQFAKQHPDLVLHVAEVRLPPDRAYIGYVRKC